MRVVLDEEGDIKEYYDYYPYGMTQRENIAGVEKAKYKFTGKELDEEGELDWYSFKKRYYNPKVGMWTSPDPLSQLRPSISPYAYCGNNPVDRIDPFGLDWIPHYNKEGNLRYYEWDEPVVCRASANSWWEGWGAEYGSPPGEIAKSTWFDRNFPLATQNDPWLYRSIRGTGNLRQDMDRFVVGVPALSFATIAVTTGGVLTVITYGPTVVGYITSAGTVVYWGMGQAYVWGETYGSYYLGRFGNAFTTRSQLVWYRLQGFYYSNQAGIYALGRGFLDSFSSGIPNIELSKWWGAGYTTGTAIRKILRF